MLGELTHDEIEQMLTTNVIGRIGCYTDQKMFVVPITYVYDGEYVLGHTIEGLKVNMLRENPECCFEVDTMQDISTWKSVIAWGTFEELRGAEAGNVQEKLFKRLGPLLASETSQPKRMGPDPTHRMHTLGRNPVIYRIRLREKTGRYEL